jgi:hypothetical protein
MRRPASALLLAKAPKRGAEIVLRPGPLERHALAGLLLQRLAIGRNCFVEPRRAVRAAVLLRRDGCQCAFQIFRVL